MTGGTCMVSVGRHRLAARVLGTGTPAVVIEPSFGGCAADWVVLARVLAADTTVVCYDRAPYGASSPARDDRTPGEIAADLDRLLAGLQVTGPLVLVGHSAGGLYVRAYAAEHLNRVAGMVLVESSHEGQGRVVDPLRSRRVRLNMALNVPLTFCRMGASGPRGDRRSVIREWQSFRRATAGQPPLPPGGLGGRPLIVLTCAPPDAVAPPPIWLAWHGLHRELAGLSANSMHLVSVSPDHHLNRCDPDLVTAAVREVVRCARSGAPLGELLGMPPGPARPDAPGSEAD